MKPYRLAAILALPVLSAAVLSGCSSSESTPENSASASPTASPSGATVDWCTEYQTFVQEAASGNPDYKWDAKAADEVVSSAPEEVSEAATTSFKYLETFVNKGTIPDSSKQPKQYKELSTASESIFQFCSESMNPAPAPTAAE